MGLSWHAGVGVFVLSWLAMVWERAGAEALDLRPQVDPLAKALLDDDAAVGLVVGIIKDGDTQVLGYGETSKGSGQTPSGETIYEIGSVSKAFTGVLLAKLVTDGHVKLDDPLQKYLPAKVTAPKFGDTPITLEHLATHTSGLPRLPDNLAPADPLNPYADYTAKRMYDFLSGHKVRRAPGEYEYSNYGMGLLGHVLGRQRRMNYERLLVAEIAKPAGMVDTCITLTKEQRNRFAPPYNAGLKADKNWDIPALNGAGGIRSTANDMLKFIAANLATDDTPLTKALHLSHEKHHDIPGVLAMGLGWHIARDGITRWHNGMTGGYSSWLAVVPEFNVGVVVLSNTATRKITELGEQVTQVACGVTVEPPKQRTVVEVDPAVLKTYEGVFEIVPQFALTVTLEDGKLMVQATNQQKFQVYPESTTKFFYRVVDAQLTFVKEDDGKVNQLILHQNGVNQVAVRRE